jgi:hypothetical protein
MAAATVVLIGLSFLTGETQALPAASATWLALAHLIVIGSVVVFVLTV